jgi:hypothetical protein
MISGAARILLGDTRHPFVDHSGSTWSSQPNCKGGESHPSTGVSVAGTEDPYLYDGGLRGFVRCTFHAQPGFYELHIYLAEPTNLEPAERVVNLIVNAVLNQTIDVVDRAGSSRAAKMLTIPGEAPRAMERILYRPTWDRLAIGQVLPWRTTCSPNRSRTPPGSRPLCFRSHCQLPVLGPGSSWDEVPCDALLPRVVAWTDEYNSRRSRKPRLRCLLQRPDPVAQLRYSCRRAWSERGEDL